MSPFSHLSLIATAGLLASCASTPSAVANTCAPTEADALGPFYVADAPAVEDLNRFGKSGDPLMLSGRVLSSVDEVPIAGARIEIWQTDGGGDYYPENNGDYADYDDADIDLRGTLLSGEDGSYAAKTLVPGAYFPRPQHFHYRITAAGYQPLVTQLYVTAEDGGRQPGGACRHAPIEETADGLRYAAPDIFLSPDP